MSQTTLSCNQQSRHRQWDITSKQRIGAKRVWRHTWRHTPAFHEHLVWFEAAGKWRDTRCYLTFFQNALHAVSLHPHSTLRSWNCTGTVLNPWSSFFLTRYSRLIEAERAADTSTGTCLHRLCLSPCLSPVLSPWSRSLLSPLSAAEPAHRLHRPIRAQSGGALLCRCDAFTDSRIS